MKIKNFKKSKKFVLSVVLAVAIIGGTVVFYKDYIARGAVYGWTQTSWSGGASTTAIAAHPGDETGWTQFYSADASISTSTPGQISLASTTSSWIETADADFNAGTKDSVYATSGAVFLLKPIGTACSTGAECLSGSCGSGVCNS